MESQHRRSPHGSTASNGSGPPLATFAQSVNERASSRAGGDEIYRARALRRRDPCTFAAGARVAMSIGTNVYTVSQGQADLWPPPRLPAQAGRGGLRRHLLGDTLWSCGPARRGAPEFLPFMMHGGAIHSRAVEISVWLLSPTINWSTSPT